MITEVAVRPAEAQQRKKMSKKEIKKVEKKDAQRLVNQMAARKGARGL
jgi:hypothetical protein